MNIPVNIRSVIFFEVEGTWYGGVHITGKTGIPVSLDREEYEEITDMTPEEYQAAAVYWWKKIKKANTWNRNS